MRISTRSELYFVSRKLFQGLRTAFGDAVVRIIAAFGRRIPGDGDSKHGIGTARTQGVKLADKRVPRFPVELMLGKELHAAHGKIDVGTVAGMLDDGFFLRGFRLLHIYGAVHLFFQSERCRV